MCEDWGGEGGFIQPKPLYMLRWFEHKQVYHPDRLLNATGTELGHPFEDVFFETSDHVVLNGWFFPGRQGEWGASLAALVCHGNGGNISYGLELCRALLTPGLSVFLFDYRGYGRSTGHPSEEGTYVDAQAAHHWLQRKGFDASRILAYGESLGGGVATELALRQATAGVVLQSTFTSIADIGAELFPWLPVRWLSRIRYDTHRKLPRLHVPVLVMHSREDRLVRFHHAEQNFAVANEPKLFRELRGGHNEPLSDRNQFLEGIRSFLRLVSGVS